MNCKKDERLISNIQTKKYYLKKYIDYYYLDYKPSNTLHEFECFPHFNNTISIYKSHNRLENGNMSFNPSAKPFQIFTPIRENVLRVTQIGQVNRIVVVFHPLGIQQFYTNLDFTKYITDFEFIDSELLQDIFCTKQTDTLTDLLDCCFVEKLQPFNNQILEGAISYIFENYENFSVSKIADHMGVSRQHLNRLFTLHLGVSIKKFQNIVLFRKTIYKKLFENPQSSFTELAHEFNFNDQSHLIKTYKALTNKSPRSFFNQGSLLGQQDTFWHLKP